MIHKFIQGFFSLVFSIAAVAVPCALADLCHSKQHPNTCVNGVGQYDGSVYQTLEAFQNLNDVELKAHAFDIC
jgi:hypothetical protein